MTTIASAPATERPVRRRRLRSARYRRPGANAWLPAWFLLVPLVLLVTFTYIPVGQMLRFSTWDWDGLDKNPEQVGLENYREVFSRPELFGVFRVSLYYVAGTVVQMAIAMYFATVLSFKVRGKNFFKGVLFFPYLINGVAISFIFLYFFRPDGVLDSTLDLLGLDTLQRKWLGDRTYINWSLAGVSVWRYMGLNFVLFLGAIQSISSDLFEASALDGANRWQQFRFIILPSIRPVLGLSLILAIQGALSVFEIPYVMTGGANGSATFVTQTVDIAFKSQKVGLASAMAVVLLAMILVVTAVQKKAFPDNDVRAVG
jgi:multiple sugar transport system permease protein